MFVKTKQKGNCLKARRGRGIFKILLTDGAIACKPIDLDRSQLGLVREEGQILYHGNMKERVVTFGNQELVKSAYSCISMLSKLKNTGVKKKDLLDIYELLTDPV